MRASFILMSALLLGACAQAPATAPPAVDPASGSVPFKTAYLGGAGGTPEQALLRSQAELDAFLARHRQPTNAGQPLPASPRPDGAAPGPTMTAPPPAPWPGELTGFDFGRYEAIAVLEGAVRQGAMVRITGVVPEGDRLRVESTRWQRSEADPSAIGCLHVVALPKAGLAARFTPTVLQETNEVPRWRAVPNPELTQGLVEQLIRRNLATGVQIQSLEKRRLGEVRAHATTTSGLIYYTDDSEVWVARGEAPGAATPVVALLSVEAQVPTAP